MKIDRHVRRLLMQLNWRHQTPATRAAKRDEPAIERWQTERYPALTQVPQLDANNSPFYAQKVILRDDLGHYIFLHHYQSSRFHGG
jgi:hypothetical protein